jgi:hypothetical protein
VALRQAARALKSNRRQFHEIVDAIAPGLLDRSGVGPVSAAQAVVSYSHPGRVRNESAFRPPCTARCGPLERPR